MVARSVCNVLPLPRRSPDATGYQVAFLRRQQKLRKVVVSALRRQSYAWHVNDTSRAMRKWKELVRRRREDERLSLELSRISAVSPTTPLGARALASGLRSYAMSGGGGGAVGMDGRGGDGTPSFYRSPFSPATADNNSLTRRRLWDQA